MQTDRNALLQALEQDPSGAGVGLTRRALPPGHVVDAPGAGPLYWVSDGVPTADDVASARAGFAASGLWPLLVEGGGVMTRHRAGPDGAQPFDAYWLGDGRPSHTGDTDPERWLSEAWTDLIADNEEDDDLEPEERVSALAPKGTAWPGLALPATFDGTAHGTAHAYADETTEFLLHNGWLPDPRMVLIPATSSSDALIAARCTLAEIDDITGHAAVLHSWEQRLGARAIALRHDTLFVSVAAAPTTEAQAAHIACEHFAFAPDNVLQNSDSFADYVDSLIGVNLWGFWWD